MSGIHAEKTTGVNVTIFRTVVPDPNSSKVHAMANPEHVEIVKQGTDAISAWRRKNVRIRLDLNEADLTGADLWEAVLTKADLAGADLRRAVLTEVDLSEAVLTKANLRGADLMGANLRGANLGGVDLRTANLLGTNFCEADLRDTDLRGAHFTHTFLFEANLSGADLRRTCLTSCDLTYANFCNTLCEETTFRDVDLSNVYALESVIHTGPSEITVSTLVNSRGQIHEAFLKGCGLSHDFIAFIPSIFGSISPIEFYSCFISYSHKDEEFCKRLHSRMRDEKMRVWYAPEDTKAGRFLTDQIDQAIRVHDKLLLVLSEESMSSDWVTREISEALKQEEIQGKRILFPIRLVPIEKIESWTRCDMNTGRRFSSEVMRYPIPNFSNWKDHDAFEKAFKRLLNDLKNDDKLHANEKENKSR